MLAFLSLTVYKTLGLHFRTPCSKTVKSSKSSPGDTDPIERRSAMRDMQPEPIDWAALPSFRLEGQAAVITGAAGGLGRVIAAALARQGAQVLLADLDLAPLEALVGELAEHEGQAAALAADVTRPEDCERMVQTALARFGRLDVMVNNAGIRIHKPALE